MAMRKAIIIGADPAGFSVAYMLLKRTDIRPIVLEREEAITLNGKGLVYTTSGTTFGTIKLLWRMICLFFKSLKAWLEWNQTGIQSQYKMESSEIKWKNVQEEFRQMGGEIYFHQQVHSIYQVRGEICSLHTINSETGELMLFSGDYFFSSTPLWQIQKHLEYSPNEKRYRKLINLLKPTVNKIPYKTRNIET
jgi:hypothetical protein